MDFDCVVLGPIILGDLVVEKIPMGSVVGRKIFDFCHGNVGFVVGS